MSDVLEITDPVLVVVGPTAVGKTALCERLFRSFDCELVSMDSMQVYRYMDIGTAKPSRHELKMAPHHLIDIRNPDEQYDAAQFVEDSLFTIKAIHKRGRLPLVTGGTGLYLSALLKGLFRGITVSDEIKQRIRERLGEEGREALFQELSQLDPDTANRLHPNDTQRIVRGLEIYHGTGVAWSEHLRRQAQEQSPVHFANMLQICLACDRQLLHDRIAQRTILMFEQGLVEEVAGLRARGYAADLPSMQAIGYRHVNAYLDGQLSLEKGKSDLIQDTKHYAKRQLTWFKRNRQLQWVDREDHGKVIKLIEKNIHKNNILKSKIHLKHKDN